MTHGRAQDELDALKAREAQKRHKLEARLLKTLWRSEAHRRLAESNIVGVAFVDLRAGITDANDEFLRTLGYPREALVQGLSWEKLTPPEKREDRRQAIVGLRRRGTVGPWESELLHASGAQVSVLYGAAMLEGSDEKAIAFVLDLTEKKAAEREARRLSEELQLRNTQLEEDLKMAREIQLALLPQRYPSFPARGNASHSRLSFAHRYVPAGPVGGDFFDVLALSDTRALILVGDVMGHGVRAALITAMMRALIEQLKPLGENPGKMLAALNAALIATLRQTDATMFVTACCARFDTQSGVLQLASAGHPTPFIVRRAAGKVTSARGESGPPLGLVDGLEYASAGDELAVDDSLVLFTDGLFELEERVGAPPADLTAVQSWVESNIQVSDAELLDGLLEEARRHSAHGTFLDDVCLVSVRRRA